MPQDRYQTRLPADDAERVDDYVENRDISQAEAVRRLIRAGLEVERDDGEIVDTRDMATANVNERARQTVTLIMMVAVALMVAFLTIVEAGLL
jgi:hypothetical protein